MKNKSKRHINLIIKKEQTKNLFFLFLNKLSKKVLTLNFRCVRVWLEQEEEFCSNQLRQKAQSPALVNRRDGITKEKVLSFNRCSAGFFISKNMLTLLLKDNSVFFHLYRREKFL